MRNSKILLFLSLLFVSFSTTSAQEVSEKDVYMSLGKQTAFYTVIEGADKKEIEKQWKNFMKEHGKVKKNKKANEFYSMEAEVKSINGSSPTDIYMKIEEGRDQATVYIWVDKGGAFVSSDEHPSKAKASADFLEQFNVHTRRVVVEKEMKEAEKFLEKLEKEQNKLEKKNQDYHKDIAKAEEKIREAEEKIAQNLIDQDNKKVEIIAQRRAVEEIINKYNNIGKGNE